MHDSQCNIRVKWVNVYDCDDTSAYMHPVLNSSTQYLCPHWVQRGVNAMYTMYEHVWGVIRISLPFVHILADFLFDKHSNPPCICAHPPKPPMCIDVYTLGSVDTIQFRDQGFLFLKIFQTDSRPRLPKRSC